MKHIMKKIYIIQLHLINSIDFNDIMMSIEFEHRNHLRLYQFLLIFKFEFTSHF
jgi:hypothetical protein